MTDREIVLAEAQPRFTNALYLLGPSGLQRDIFNKAAKRIVQRNALILLDTDPDNTEDEKFLLLPEDLSQSLNITSAENSNLSSDEFLRQGFSILHQTKKRNAIYVINDTSFAGHLTLVSEATIKAKTGGFYKRPEMPQFFEGIRGVTFERRERLMTFFNQETVDGISVIAFQEANGVLTIRTTEIPEHPIP